MAELKRGVKQEMEEQQSVSKTTRMNYLRARMVYLDRFAKQELTAMLVGVGEDLPFLAINV